MLFAGAPALLVVFFYAYRYLSAARRMRRGGAVFVYEIWDGLLLMGKPASAGGLTVLGVMCIVVPLTIFAVAARELGANALASLRSPCKSLLTLEDARELSGKGLRLEHSYGSRHSCSVTFRGDADAELTVEVMSTPLYGAKGFREERERHGAMVTDTPFGGAGLLAVEGPGGATDERDARANQDFERRLAAPRVQAKGSPRGASPMDSWLDSLPFRGAEVWTLLPCGGARSGPGGVSVSIRASGPGQRAPELIAAARDRAAPRLETACRLSSR